MIDALALFAEARNVYGFTGTVSDVQTAVAAIDRKPFEAAESTRYRVEVWDEVSDLGGRPAEWWHANFAQRNDWPHGGKVFTVYVDGNLQTVQPHNPFSAGFVPMTQAQAEAIGSQIVAARVEDAVDTKVKSQVLVVLLSA